jgi:UDPglucose--hexose-1-phosphate uridylyltransferase
MEKTTPEGPQHRWDPLLREWVIFAPQRNTRPFQGKNFVHEPKKTWDCPFCPNAPEGAGEWVVKQLPNRFASLNEDATPFHPQILGNTLQTASNYGKCEVILYSQDHNASFGTLSHENITALIELWRDRYIALGKIPQMVYPFIMENRGKEVGNSMSHPHGQIYSFPYLPPKIERKFQAFKDYEMDVEGKACLMCDIVRQELDDHRRIIEENGSFIAGIPFSAHWGFEVHIIARQHTPSLAEMDAAQIGDLATIMRRVVQRYDALYTGGPVMPYIMAMHNAPVNIPDREKWHFHIEYYTPYRGPGKWKFLAGVELGTNTFINDSLPEQNAQLLRDVPLSE